MSRRRKTKNGQRQKSTKTIHIIVRPKDSPEASPKVSPKISPKVSPLEQSLPRVSLWTDM